jgi:FkbM family methyltransferase
VLSLRATYGIARSLVVYYGQPWKARRRRELYRTFISPGDLCFDVGAHVGNRVGCWLELGACVLAIEPQPDLMAVLRVLYGRQQRVSLRECALAEAPGVRRINISSATPTVSSLSSDWMSEVRRDPRFASVSWDRSCEVQVDTLDGLIARHGKPAFCKIDVEGYELEVLAGLSQPLAAVSFEYIPVALERALACVQRLSALGPYEFRPSEVESMRWATSWLSADAIREWLRRLPLSAGSGDVYARLAPCRSTAPA